METSPPAGRDRAGRDVRRGTARLAGPRRVVPGGERAAPGGGEVGVGGRQAERTGDLAAQERGERRARRRLEHLARAGRRRCSSSGSAPRAHRTSRAARARGAASSRSGMVVSSQAFDPSRITPPACSSRWRTVTSRVEGASGPRQPRGDRVVEPEPAALDLLQHERRGEGLRDRRAPEARRRRVDRRPGLEVGDAVGTEEHRRALVAQAVGDTGRAVGVPQAHEQVLGDRRGVGDLAVGEWHRGSYRSARRAAGAARAQTRVRTEASSDSRSTSPSVEPSSALLARSGCGIRPTTLPASFAMPAMSSIEPLGLSV